MCFFSKKKNIYTLLNGFVDFHSHILPGVDDGVRNFEKSKDILSSYYEAGVKKVYLTPHVMEDVPNTKEGLTKRFEELKAYLEKESVKVPQLELASENMLDGAFAAKLENGELLTLGNNHVLIETSYYNAPYNLKELIFKLISKSYTPILAHPERYDYMQNPDYEQLKEMGVLFQLNLPSLMGLYGSHVQKKAKQLLMNGYYSFVGSDLHRMSLLDSIKRATIDQKAYDKLAELIQSSTSVNL